MAIDSDDRYWSTRVGDGGKLSRFPAWGLAIASMLIAGCASFHPQLLYKVGFEPPQK